MDLNYFESKRKKILLKVIFQNPAGLFFIGISPTAVIFAFCGFYVPEALIYTSIPVLIAIGCVCFYVAYMNAKKFEYEIKMLFADDMLKEILKDRDNIKFCGSSKNGLTLTESSNMTEEMLNIMTRMFDRIEQTGFKVNTHRLIDEVYAGEFCSRNVIICDAILETKKHHYCAAAENEIPYGFHGIFVFFDIKNNIYSDYVKVRRPQSVPPGKLQILTGDKNLHENISASGLIDYLSGLKHNTELFLDNTEGLITIQTSHDVLKIGSLTRSLHNTRENSKFIREFSEILAVTENVFKICDGILH